MAMQRKGRGEADSCEWIEDGWRRGAGSGRKGWRIRRERLDVLDQHWMDHDQRIDSLKCGDASIAGMAASHSRLCVTSHAAAVLDVNGVAS